MALVGHESRHNLQDLRRGGMWDCPGSRTSRGPLERYVLQYGLRREAVIHEPKMGTGPGEDAILVVQGARA